MAIFTTKACKTGGASIMVIIPKAIVKGLHLEPGDPVEIIDTGNGVITIRPRISPVEIEERKKRETEGSVSSQIFE